MFYRFPEGYFSFVMKSAIQKAGSEKKLSQKTGIPQSSIYYLKNELRVVSEKYLAAIEAYTKFECRSKAIQKLPKNWRQIKGGNALITKKRKEGSLHITIQKLRTASSQRMRQWHASMKALAPKEYSRLQFERLKGSRRYKQRLENGLFVRNELEKTVGEFLYSKHPDTSYEACVTSKGPEKKIYFPDFLISDLIVEVTAWKNPSKEKIAKLSKKFKDYKKLGFRVCWFIPQTHRKFYKNLPGPIVSNLEELERFIGPP